MNYKFLSALALVLSMYTGVKADAPSKAMERLQAAPSALKIACVDVGYILSILPEAKKNNAEIQSFQKQLDNQIQTKIKEGQEKADAFHQQLDSLTEAQKKQKVLEFQKLELAIRELEEQKHAKMAEKYKTLMQPIYDKMHEVINKIAVEHAYVFVLSKNTEVGPVVLFAHKSVDISEMVLEALKAVAPKAPQPPVVGPKAQSKPAGGPAKPAKKK
ncbi:OmpH family outer membrane protein [Cardinium endosymbiont of Nabis limbatus]|uniref:OmpH family outer membrane protein n=1 Tax=Cardinium endosymbiont of Nabis limbatus TaxID=3066217 RepID=UPI003AF3D2C9